MYVSQARHGEIDMGIVDQISTEIALRSVLIIGDGRKLNQVMRNLLSNALKFTPPGGTVDVHVAVTEHAANASKVSDLKSIPFIRIDVTDTGPGLSKVCLHLFIQFGLFSSNERIYSFIGESGEAVHRNHSI